MPTTARLVAALWFAAIGWLAANAFLPQLGEGASPGYLREVAAGIGLLAGWLVMGAMAGRGYADAVGIGLTTSVILAVVTLLGFSTREMIVDATHGRYGDSPMAAVAGIFSIMLDRAGQMAIPGVLGTLVLGGILGGLAVEAASRRWR